MSKNSEWPPLLVRINPAVMDILKFHKDRTGNSVTSMARDAIERYAYELEKKYEGVSREDPDE